MFRVNPQWEEFLDKFFINFSIILCISSFFCFISFSISLFFIEFSILHSSNHLTNWRVFLISYQKNNFPTFKILFILISQYYFFCILNFIFIIIFISFINIILVFNNISDLTPRRFLENINMVVEF